MRRNRIVYVALAAIALGCGSKSKKGTPDHDSFATAEVVTLGQSVSDTLEAAGDVDFFAVDLAAAGWLDVTVAANGASSPIDPVATLYDSATSALAANDDAPAGGGPTSEVLLYAPAAGRVYVKVTDAAGQGGAAYAYLLTVRTVDDSTAGVTIESATDPGNDLATAIAADVSGGVGLLGGQFDSASDSDVFSIASTAGSRLTVESWPSGAQGNGSAVGTQQLLLLDGASAEQAASSLATPALVVPTGAATYYLFVNGANSATPATWSARLTLASESLPPESQEATNGNYVGAELLPQLPGTGTRYGVLALLPAGDLDFYGFAATSGQTISLECRGEVDGSGVRGLTATLYDPSDTMIGNATETASAPAKIDVTAAASGTFVFEIQDSSQDATDVGDYVRCLATVGA